jgi:hypothetical protein
MALANTSLVNIAYVKEAAFGVVPTTGNHKKLRVTGESLDYTINKEASEEINSSRTSSSMIPLSGSASGGIETEVSYLEYDDFLESTLQSEFLEYGTGGVGATFSATFAANTITAAVAPTGTSAFTNLKKGQFFTVLGSGTINDGKIFRASLVTAPTSTVITLDSSTPASVGTGAATTVSSSRLVNGTAQTSFSIERQSSDIGEYWVYRGMTPSSLDISISAGARSTFSFNFMGKGLTRKESSTNLSGTAAESNSYEIHSGVTGPSCVLWVDGAPLDGTYVQSVGFNYDNALREQTAICSLDAVGIGSGTISATGTLEVYFNSGELYEKFKLNENVSVIFSTTDTSGNGYVFTLPKCNFSKVGTGAGGKDSDMMLSLEFTALRDNTNADTALRNLIQIDRIGAASA